MGFLTRDKNEDNEPAGLTMQQVFDGLAPKFKELYAKLDKLDSRLDKLEKKVNDVPNASDFRLLASELGRLEGEMERMESKHKEGMLALYAQVHKELRSIRGDRVIEMIDLEPASEETLEEASDQLSQLAKTWRKRRAHPGPPEPE